MLIFGSFFLKVEGLFLYILQSVLDLVAGVLLILDNLFGLVVFLQELIIAFGFKQLELVLGLQHFFIQLYQFLRSLL